MLNSLKGFDLQTLISKKLNLPTLPIVMTGQAGKAMEKQLSIWFPSKSTPALQTFQKFWKEHSRLCLKRKWKRKETFTRLKENIVMFLLNEWIELFYLRNIFKTKKLKILIKSFYLHFGYFNIFSITYVSFLWFYKQFSLFNL